jgi:hypothetical protein
MGHRVEADGERNPADLVGLAIGGLSATIRCNGVQSRLDAAFGKKYRHRIRGTAGIDRLRRAGFQT